MQRYRSQVDEPTLREVSDFLLAEAEFLDARDFDGWLDMLTEDVAYRVPVRSTRTRAEGSDVVPESTWYRDTHGSLEMRVRRLQSRNPVSEEPPSRTRHFVSNIRVVPGQGPEELQVTSNLLVYRNRGASITYDLFSGERHDVLRREDGAWKLARREVLLDQAVLGAQDLSMFF